MCNLQLYQLIPEFQIFHSCYISQITYCRLRIVQQPSRHFPLNLAKIPPNQVIADFGRGSYVESEFE